jgi:hypothetical protein
MTSLRSVDHYCGHCQADHDFAYLTDQPEDGIREQHCHTPALSRQI